MSEEKCYIAIDLKSFYASVECVDRGLDPLRTNLVVADLSRTEKTICLAVSPSLKTFGIPGRARLFEVSEMVRQVNASRQQSAPERRFSGKSWMIDEVLSDPSLALDYLIAKPRMARYMEVSTAIYDIYLRHVSQDDIHVYSIDEVFIDATQYLRLYHISAHDFAMRLVKGVLSETGITATAGIGTNLFLAKVAMDIVAKHIPADKDGVRIAEMDEMSFRRQLWSHRPLTDFWRVGPGYVRKLQQHGMYTMGDVARMSCLDEDLLYKLFGVNAELLIDHAWGYESCTIKAIQSYRPSSSSLSTGQVLKEPYSFGKARLVVREMADQLSLSLVEKRLVTTQLSVVVGYDVSNLKSKRAYSGAVHLDRYGRKIPEGAHGAVNFTRPISSSRILAEAAVSIFDRAVDRELLVRRLNVIAANLTREGDCQGQKNASQGTPRQLELFQDEEEKEAREFVEKELERERRCQEAILTIRDKLGKNAILKGMNLDEGATARERNQQVGGHNA